MIQIYNELKQNQNMIDKGQNVIPVSSAKILCPEKIPFSSLEKHPNYMYRVMCRLILTPN